MTAAPNSMARLPADGESVQSRSSGSVQITPGVSLETELDAVARAPSSSNVQVEHEEQMRAVDAEEAAQPRREVSPTLEEQPTVDERAAIAAAAVHGVEDQCIADKSNQKVAKSTSRMTTEEESRLMARCPDDDGNDEARSRLAVTANSAASHTWSASQLHSHDVLRSVKSAPVSDFAIYTMNASNTEGNTTVVGASSTVVAGQHDPTMSCTQGEQASQAPTAEVVRPRAESLAPTAVFVDTIAESLTTSVTGANLAFQTSGQAEAESEAGKIHSESKAVPDAEDVVPEPQAEPDLAHAEEQEQQVEVAEAPSLDEGGEPTPEPDGVIETPKVDSEQGEDVFVACGSFTGAKPGYVFKTGDRGLGFYIDGYVDQSARGALILSHRPWNAGPGELANRRGPLGPIPKLFKKIVPFRTRQEKKAAEESDTRPFMARMVAQRNSRAFQSNLFGREHALDSHILQLLEKFSDPSFFKKKHGYNVHGQMLGKDGKMIIKVTPEKTEEEKAKLSWYRKVYEDRLGKHLPTKRLGDSIEARREAYAYSRHFSAALNGREEELNRALTKALKGQTKLEFITEDYHYPGAYDTDGKVILEKGATISNELHRTDAQTERACTYRYKAIRRYRAAHDDIMDAISKKDKALQKLFKKTDPTILLEMSEEAVKSSGMGIYRQSRTAVDGSGNPSGESSTAESRKERPEQLREKFTQRLKVEIKGKDKALQKEIAMLEEKDAEQIIGSYGKCVEVLPGSWREDPESLKMMQKRRKELIEENAADRCKVVCPWRPGGKHIAQEPWQPFTPRSHRPPIRSASEEKPETLGARRGTTAAREDLNRGSDSSKRGAERRPHTAPMHRQKGFMDAISPRARRILATQSPGTPLHSAFSTYSTDPFPLDSTHRSSPSSDTARKDCSLHDFPPSRTDKPFETSGGVGRGTHRRAWAETPCSSTCPQPPRGGVGERPQSAAAEISRKAHALPRRPATACGAREPRVASSNPVAAEYSPEPETVSSTYPPQVQEYSRHDGCRDLHVRSGPGVTVLWARLCAPSSDLVYKSSVWPRAPKAPPTRKRAKSAKKDRVASGDAANVRESKGGQWGDSLPGPESRTSAGTDANDRNVEQAQLPGGRADGGGPLEDLEDSLYSSSSKRVDQRRRVFRGYAERSRREQTWDPGSVFYAEGASEHHITDARIFDGRRKGAGIVRKSGLPSMRSPSGRSGTSNKKQRSQASLDARPVDMDWEKVDMAYYDDNTRTFQKALDERLFVVATDDEGTGRLGECFREAQELVEAANELLGCPSNERERFRKQIGEDFGFGSYVATVSRLNLLWTLACGVVEIVHMMQRRRNLMEVFHPEQERLASTAKYTGICIEAAGGTTGEESHAPLPDSAATSFRERCVRHYEIRLELAEYAIAIAESIKLWISILPWRVRVLYGNNCVLSSLGAEEEALPWPPDPKTLLRLDGASAIVQTQEFGPQKRCTSEKAEEEGKCMEGGGRVPEKKEI